MFADLHCHPAHIPFNNMRNTKEEYSDHFNLYHIPKKTLKAYKKQKKKGFTQKLTTFNSSDIGSLGDGEVKLVFASLYPLETGFFMGNDKKVLSGTPLSKAIESLVKNRKLGRFLSGAVVGFNVLFSPLLNNEFFFRDLVQHFLMKFNMPRINFIQGQKRWEGEYYDYFNELKKEFEFYEKSKILDQEPPFEIVKSGNEVNNIIHQQQKIAIVLTVEGMHSISQERNPKDKGKRLQLVTEDTLMNRIQWLKDHHVFFMTYSHHFDNELAGHAKSVPALLREITDQVPGCLDDFNELGLKALLELLSIKKVGDHYEDDPNKGRRILIDVKHMAPKSRATLYQIISKHQSNQQASIPVIASHVGYGNKKLLSEFATVYRQEKDHDTQNGFKNWGINLCDEDVKHIVHTEGLIGISFDQGILGVDPSTKTKKWNRDQWFQVIFRNIEAMVLASSRELVGKNPERIWKCLTIGTDFDGFIDVVDAFPSAEFFDEYKLEFKKLIQAKMDNPIEKERLLMENYTTDEIVDGFCFNNAYNFTIKHFNTVV